MPFFCFSQLEGVTIAELQADMEGHGISVETHEDISMYQSTSFLTVAGAGFKPGGTDFRFGNTLSVGSEYTVEVTETSATFTLTEGSLWQKVMRAQPTPNVLRAKLGQTKQRG